MSTEIIQASPFGYVILLVTIVILCVVFKRLYFDAPKKEGVREDSLTEIAHITAGIGYLLVSGSYVFGDGSPSDGAGFMVFGAIIWVAWGLIGTAILEEEEKSNKKDI